MIPDKLLVKAFEKLDELKLDEEISEKTTKNWEIFVDCAKQYHDSYKNLLFSNDYTRIKKTLTFQEQVNKFNPTEQ